MDLIAYALAKKYTDKSIEGGGAVKGKNCTISSIEPIEGGNRVTFQWTLDNGVIETETMDVMDGENGADGSQVTESDTNGNIVVDGTEIQVYDDTEVKDAISDIDDIITTDETTIEGNPINFSTKSAQNAQSTIIDLEPIQDLHGYDKPWVGGAGKNIFNPDSTEKKWVQSNGTVADSPNAKSMTISVSAGQSYAISNKNATNLTNILLLAYFDSSDNLLQRDALANGQTSMVKTAPADSSYLIASFYTWSASDEQQLELGSSATSYAPWKNECPISGRTEIGILGCGKNLINPTLKEYNNEWCAFGGTLMSNIPDGSIFLNSGTYTFSCDQTLNLISIRESPETEIARVSNINKVTFSISKPMPIKISINKSNGDFDEYEYQLELGSQETPYSPYTKSNDLTINLGQTVYGGTLDAENGVLVVDRGYEVYDGSEDESWGMATSYGSDTNRYYINKPQNMGNKNCFGICNLYNKVNADASSTIKNGEIFIGDTNLVLRDYNIDSVESLRTFLSNTNLNVCYKLATPIIIQLTPNVISLLEGINNISTTGDKITLTYRDGKVATLGDLTSAVDNLDSKIDESKILTDTVTGTKYKLVVTDGVLGIEEVTEPNILLSSPALLGSSTPENDSSNETDTEDNNTEEV